MAGGYFSLKWNNHSFVFLELLKEYRLKEMYCDATIVCHGKFFPAHRLVLASCSDYFYEIFDKSQCKHPFIILKDIKPIEVEALLNYMYNGEVNVLQESLPELIKAAESLKVKGLAVPDEDIITNVNDTGIIPMEETSICPLGNVPPTKKKYSDKIIKSEIYEPTFHSSEEPASPIDLSHEANSEEKLELLFDANNFSDETIVRSVPLIDSQEIEQAISITSAGQYQGSSPLCVKVELQEDFSEGKSSALNEYHLSPVNSQFAENVVLNNINQDLYPIKQEDMNCNSFEMREETDQNTFIENAPSSSSGLKEIYKDGEDVSVDLNSTHSLFEVLMVKNHISPNRIDKRYSCPKCSYNSTYRASVTRHIVRKHTLEKPFTCQQANCPYRAATKDTVDEHFLRHHGHMVYNCEDCQYSTKLKRLLYRHAKSIHQKSIHQKRRLLVSAVKKDDSLVIMDT